MPPQIGTSICILRSLIPNRRIIAVFSPLRTTRFIPARSITIERLPDQTTPSFDFQVEITDLDQTSDLLLVAGFLAKIDRSPLFLIDAGADGSCRIISDPSSFVAGSCGLSTPVPLNPPIRHLLAQISSNPHQLARGLVEMAHFILSTWPPQIFSLLPRSEDLDFLDSGDTVRAILGIAMDLGRITPLITGTFPLGFRRSDRAELLVLGSFSDLRLRYIKRSDYHNEDILKKIRAIVMLLIDRKFPVWTFFILEDLFSPLVQELICYIPHLFHLRSSPHYGGHRGGISPVKFEGDILVNPRIVDRVERNLPMLVGNLYPYIQPESLSIHKKVEIRHLWRQGSDPLRPIEDRPDLDIDFDLDDWRNSLSYYLTRMSAIHDPGEPPSVVFIKHIIDQFWDPTSRSFKMSSSGLLSPVWYISLLHTSDHEIQSIDLTL